MLRKFSLSAQDNFTSWNSLLPGTNSSWIAGKKCNNKILSAVCKSTLLHINAVKSKTHTAANLNLRLEIIALLINVPVEELRKFVCTPSLRFNLFACLYNIIFLKDKFKGTKKEILLNLCGYLDNYPQLPFKQVATNLKHHGSLYESKNSFDYRTSYIFSCFKILLPYFDYDIDFGITNNVRISPSLCRSIKSRESVPHITLNFITDVFSEIYNYDTMMVNSAEVKSSYSVKSGLVGKKSMSQLLSKVGKLVESNKDISSRYHIAQLLAYFLSNEYPSDSSGR